jgi:perosamine synthetase
VRESFGVRHVFLVSSGTAALAVILRALGTLSGSHDVIIPAYTCFSVAAAVVRAGFRLKLVDVDLRSLDFDPESLERAIDGNTLCVVAPHPFGMPFNLARIRALCDRRQVFLVEDAAQAMGGRYEGRTLGSVGHVGFFSLGRGKIVTAGSGGIIVTSCDRIAEAITAECRKLVPPSVWRQAVELVRVALTALLIRPTLYWFPSCLPFLGLGETRFEPGFTMGALSGVSAGLVRHWRERLREGNHARVQAGCHFAAELGLAWPRGDQVPYLRVPVVMPSREARDRAVSLSRQQGLGVSLMYPTPINEIEAIRSQFDGQSFPAAREVAARLLALPAHHLVREIDRAAICRVIAASSGVGAPTP